MVHRCVVSIITITVCVTALHVELLLLNRCLNVLHWVRLADDPALAEVLLGAWLARGLLLIRLLHLELLNSLDLTVI